MAILIKGGYVKPISGPDIPEGDVLVDNGKIVAVGRKVKAPAKCRTIDAHGLLVTPGLVEAHCHLGLHGEATRWEGTDINERSNPVTPHMRAIDGFRPDDEAVGIALAAGVLFCWQGFFYMLGKFAAGSDLLQGTLVNELSIVGGVLIISSGLSLLRVKDCKTLNYLPALLVPPIWFLVRALVG